MKLKNTFLSFIVLVINFSYASASLEDSIKHKYFEDAYQELKDMLEGKKTLDFERAVFVMENAYWDNQFKYEAFQNNLNVQENFIRTLIDVNDRSEEIDFRVSLQGEKINIASLRYTAQEKKDLYNKLLSNWGIYKYMTDTVSYSVFQHLPLQYSKEDPFGKNDWKNSQVLNLLVSPEQKGNCLALASLFKIFSNRLNSGANLCTAPGHIYIQHQDHKGDVYNVELTSGSHPTDGSIQTLTYTNIQLLKNDIALRQLTAKQEIALCLVNLGKGYEHKFNTKKDGFVLRCAELALKYDDKNLNALLLKNQVLEDKLLTYSLKNNLTTIEEINKDTKALELKKQLEESVKYLHKIGYREMPKDMKQLILANLSPKQGLIYVKNHTPNPYTTIKVKDKNDTRYSTISNGLYPEANSKKGVIQYGYFSFDERQQKLISFSDTANSLLIDPVAFAMSIDPLFAKYTDLSPYNFVANSPLIAIDPDGRKIVIYYKNDKGKRKKIVLKKMEDIQLLKDVKNNFVQDVYVTMEYLKDEKALSQAITMRKKVKVRESSEKKPSSVFQPYNNTIIYNSKEAVEVVEDDQVPVPMNERIGTGKIQSPALGFLHELAHFLNKAEDAKAQTKRRATEDPLYHNLEEKKVIEEVETPAVDRLNKKRTEEQGKEPKRTNHGGIGREVDSPTSTKPIKKRVKTPGPRNL